MGYLSNVAKELAGRPYHILMIWDDKAKAWSQEFGDYDKSSVKEEMESNKTSGEQVKSKNMKIITAQSDDQNSVKEAVTVFRNQFPNGPSGKSKEVAKLISSIFPELAKGVDIDAAIKECESEKDIAGLEKLLKAATNPDDKKKIKNAIDSLDYAMGEHKRSMREEAKVRLEKRKAKGNK